VTFWWSPREPATEAVADVKPSGGFFVPASARPNKEPNYLRQLNRYEIIDGHGGCLARPQFRERAL
jgi:hypothetical protein